MDYDREDHRYVVSRSLPPGRYPYKFIMDGCWTYSADHPTFQVRYSPIAKRLLPHAIVRTLRRIAN
jgi:hypothetical protein